MRAYGSRVKIAGQKGSLGDVFNGQKGTVVGYEKDGSTVLFRVLLDTPVHVEGVGSVKDDLWAGSFLKTIRN